MSDEKQGQGAGGPEAEPLGPLVSEAMIELLGGVARRGRSEVGRLARRGKERLEANQARKDLDHLYQKLGRETVRLVEAGEVVHPGLVAGAERIAQHQKKAAAAEAQEEGG